jgi:hypothetical protein
MADMAESLEIGPVVGTGDPHDAQRYDVVHVCRGYGASVGSALHTERFFGKHLLSDGLPGGGAVDAACVTGWTCAPMHSTAPLFDKGGASWMKAGVETGHIYTTLRGRT